MHVSERRHSAVHLLKQCGADTMLHPGGTLLAHLQRVEGLLVAWGAPETLQLAGLCHAAYGTGGFAPVLMGVEDRGRLAGVIGSEAEALVYLYGGCDRDVAYAQVGTGVQVCWQSRLGGGTVSPDASALAVLLELTAANEVDVMAHNAELRERYGDELADLFARARGWLCAPAWEAVTAVLGHHRFAAP